MNGRRIHAGHHGRAVGEFDDELAWLVNGQFPVRPGRGRRVELDRILMLCRRAVLAFHPDRSGGERGGEVADLQFPFGERVGMRHVDARTVDRRRGYLGRVARAYSVRGVASDLVGLGDDHCDDLTVVMDFRSGQRHVRV